MTCYYFRNKRGLFFGDLNPYFLIEDDEIASAENYWKQWERNIPNFHMTNVDSLFVVHAYLKEKHDV